MDIEAAIEKWFEGQTISFINAAKKWGALAGCDKCDAVTLTTSPTLEDWKAHHFHGKCMPDLYRKVPVDLCACQSWVRTPVQQSMRDTEHHPSCDGKGFHINHPQHTAAMMAKKPETALQLLVIDLGDCCVLKVEKNAIGIQWLKLGTMQDKLVGLGDGVANSTRESNGAKIVHVLFEPFNKLRSAIDGLDGERPVPRLERDNIGYWLYEDAETKEDIPIDTYSALSELAGHPLPVYEPKKAEWIKWDPVQKQPVNIWRYTLKAN